MAFLLLSLPNGVGSVSTIHPVYGGGGGSGHPHGHGSTINHHPHNNSTLRSR